MESLIEVTKCTLNLRGVEGPITVPVECEAIVLVFCSDVDSGWWASGGPGPAGLCWTLRPMISLPGQPPATTQLQHPMCCGVYFQIHRRSSSSTGNPLLSTSHHPAQASYVLCSLLPHPPAILLLFHTHGWLIYAGNRQILHTQNRN